MAFQDGEWVINQIEPGFEQFVLRVQFGIYFPARLLVDINNPDARGCPAVISREYFHL